MVTWAFAVTNRAGVIAATLEPTNTLLTVRVNGHAELKGNQDARTSAAVELVPAASAVRAWRNSILRFNGQVSEPLTRKADVVSFRAADPWEFLSLRRRQTDTVYTATDAALILKDLVDDENARENTFLRVATPPATVSRTLEVTRGKQIAEVGRDLANAADGFFYRVVPVGDSATAMGELTMLYPAAGADRPGAKFFYNPDAANIEDDWTQELRLPMTRVVALGARAGDTQLIGSDENALARAAFGLMETELSYTDVTSQALLDDLASESVDPAPPAVYKITPITYDPDGEYVPALFDDFFPGDRVRLTIDHGATQVDGWALVSEATVRISDRGATEKLESLTLEVA